MDGIQDAFREGLHAQLAGGVQHFIQQRHRLLSVTGAVALKQGVCVVAASPGQLRAASAFAAEDESLFKVAYRSVQLLKGMSQQTWCTVIG